MGGSIFQWSSGRHLDLLLHQLVVARADVVDDVRGLAGAPQDQPLGVPHQVSSTATRLTGWPASSAPCSIICWIRLTAAPSSSSPRPCSEPGDRMVASCTNSTRSASASSAVSSWAPMVAVSIASTSPDTSSTLRFSRHTPCFSLRCLFMSFMLPKM
uniref:Secreted protein n=1 Tax=Ixodes ricinus TaxID=34613 RepID=A0A6B0UWB0_IXORI